MPLIFQKVCDRIFSELMIRVQPSMENLVRNGAMLWERGFQTVHNLMSADAIILMGAP
jgi:hypothetical protein